MKTLKMSFMCKVLFFHSVGCKVGRGMDSKCSSPCILFSNDRNYGEHFDAKLNFRHFGLLSQTEVDLICVSHSGQWCYGSQRALIATATFQKLVFFFFSLAAGFRS